MMQARPNHEQGIVLPMVMLIMLIMVVLGTALLAQSGFESRRVMNGDSNMQAYYVAKSGAEAVSQYLIDNPDSLSTLAENSPSAWTQLVDSAHLFRVVVAPNYIPNSTEISSSVTITSTGQVNSGSGVSNSTVNITLYGNNITGFSWDNAVRN